MNLQAQQVDSRDAVFILHREDAPRKEPLLAGLPHAWVGAAIALGKLSSSAAHDSATSPLSFLSLVSLALFAITCLAVIFFAWRRSWPLWTASWYSYAVWMLFVLAGLATLWMGELPWQLNMILIFSVLGGIALGYLFLFRHFRLHAVLVALFLMPVMTLFFLESIPDNLEAILSLSFGLLAGVAASAVVRWWSWPAGVTMALGANLIAAAALTYVSIYHTEVPNFYGDSYTDALLTFGMYITFALVLFLGPAVFWRIWGARTDRQQAHVGGN